MDPLCAAQPSADGLLGRWLSPASLARFREQHWRRAPFASAGTACSEIASCTWARLDAFLRDRPAPDTLVITRGKLVDCPCPTSLPELELLFERGIGIVLRHAERHGDELAHVSARLQQDIPGEQRVLVFATPRGVHGFGWHYDAEEVFIIQTEGDKEYFFRRNTIDPEPQRGFQPDFSQVHRETSPIMSCRLLPGDWLYLPRGYWHVARPGDHSLSISIGIFPTSP